MEYRSVDLYEYFSIPRAGDGGSLQIFAPEKNIEIPERIRPAILIIPGGGYEFISEREGEPVAIRFLSKGFAAFVLTYTINAGFPVPLIEAAMAMAYIRENAQSFYVDKDHVCALGFSAGGHLAGMLATLYVDPAVKNALGSHAKSVRPDAVLLSYPVLTTKKEFTHWGTANVISGGKRTEGETFTGTDEKLMQSLSLETRVTKDCPPAFIWHTFEDGAVSVENSLLYAEACRRFGVPFELHIFNKGDHGLSLTGAETEVEILPPEVRRVAVWTELACGFLSGYGFNVRAK